MMFTLVFPNEFQTCQSEDTRKDQSVGSCLFLCCGLGRECVSLIGMVFILCNHFNTQLILLVYLILCG